MAAPIGYLDVARGQVGYVEKRSDITKYWDDLYPPFQGSPWSFAFVSWCLKQAGQLNLIGGKPMYYTPTGVNVAITRKQWSRTPKVGSLIFYDWGTGMAQHVEFVLAIKGAALTTIGGNYSDKVGLFKHTTSEALGYWHIGGVPIGTGGTTTTLLRPKPGKYAGVPLDAAQIANAVTICAVGVKLKLPKQGLCIALMTAMQESRLMNLNYGDRDSMGLFQQRPSQGWGTVAQIMDPTYSATKFYQALVKVPGWQTLPMWKAAARVQRPFEPYEIFYDNWKDMAIQLVDAALRLGVEDPETLGDDARPEYYTGTLKDPLPQTITGAEGQQSVHFASEERLVI